MTDQDNLRNRIAEVISGATTGWVRDEYVTELSEGDYIAQAIIDELGLSVETQSLRWMDPNGPFPQSRVVGKWEDE